jgi:tetratricopeptide (TPR) repeat protein
MLKEAEFNIIEKEFKKESEILMKLYAYSAYRPDLRKYLEKILEFKERFYYDTAVQLEKDKKWENAKNLYQAILTINKNNFDANYRIGLLCLTLQQVNESFEYMQNAMKLKKDDPRVQYQMGVLLFSSGKAKEAMQYFQYSIDLNNDSAQVYFYLGLSYEETGRILEAKSSYEKAALKDPNDSDIQLSLERINQKIEDERNRWRQKDPENQNEEESGERVPLPVNKSAYEWRITDEEAKKMKP